MKVLYSYTGNNERVIVKNAINAHVLLVIKDSSNYYVYYAEEYAAKVYLNKIRDMGFKPNPFDLLNFIKIELDEEFFYYLNFIEKNYNYNGKHIEEKVTGLKNG